MPANFTWTPFYEELASALSGWENRQSELIAFLESLRKEGYVISSLQDKNRDGEKFLLQEIDPFTFFGVINRGIQDKQKILILAAMKKQFQMQSDLPVDFEGIPTMNNQQSWFISYQDKRKSEDVPWLWRFFELAVQPNPLENEQFSQAFDQALTVRGVNINLTMGLFWIRPKTFLSLDRNIREFLHIDIPKGGLTSQFYLGVIKDLVKSGQSILQTSKAAWETTHKVGTQIPPSIKEAQRDLTEISYWLVGAFWDGDNPPDQSQRFLREGIWENGYQDRYLDDVKSMKAKDRIAIKSASTQRKNLPFDAQDRTVSRMDIKAIGIIVANRNDGRTVEVEWDPEFEAKIWYFFTNRNTLWQIRTDNDYKYLEYSRQLIDFIWYGKDQNYGWFCEQWFKNVNEGKLRQINEIEVVRKPYSIEDIIASGVFLDENELNRVLDRLRAKKALILQGPPGVGKTFIARKLAYALIEEENNNLLEMVQFHQSYSYDDFVRGYRPLPEKTGSFGLRDGVFFKFCQNAKNDPEGKYVFIIDEINRGNVSQIFGELLMLIEADKRDVEFAVQMVYQSPEEPHFFIPPNVFLIGLMNVADRSLAMVDYALRRRFAFFSLLPQFERQVFQKWLIDHKMPGILVDFIISKMIKLNQKIKEDPLLGENYQIGHSYFCPKGDNFIELDKNWYREVVETEIAPLLKEYWFDNPQKAIDTIKQLFD